MEHLLSTFSELIMTIRRLRGDNGCPWDQKQTTQSLARYLDEEFAEITQAIENDDHDNLCEELGDFLYLIIMLAEINEQNGMFRMADVVAGINQKLVRRHPHVFGDSTVSDEKTLRRQWHRIKEEEKGLRKKT